MCWEWDASAWPRGAATVEALQGPCGLVYSFVFAEHYPPMSWWRAARRAPPLWGILLLPPVTGAGYAGFATRPASLDAWCSCMHAMLLKSCTPGLGLAAVLLECNQATGVCIFTTSWAKSMPTRADGGPVRKRSQTCAWLFFCAAKGCFSSPVATVVGQRNSGTLLPLLLPLHRLPSCARRVVQL